MLSIYVTTVITTSRSSTWTKELGTWCETFTVYPFVWSPFGAWLVRQLSLVHIRGQYKPNLKWLKYWGWRLKLFLYYATRMITRTPIIADRDEDYKGVYISAISYSLRVFIFLAKFKSVILFCLLYASDIKFDSTNKIVYSFRGNWYVVAIQIRGVESEFCFVVRTPKFAHNFVLHVFDNSSNFGLWETNDPLPWPLWFCQVVWYPA